MACKNPRCMGNYNFSRIVFYAKKRFVEGCSTIDLLEAAGSQREKEEIALVSLLDVEDDKVRELQLFCNHTGFCKAIDCRDKLKRLIGEELAFMDGCEYSFL